MVSRTGAALTRSAAAPTTMGGLADPATFAGSGLLLSGIVNPATLKAVVDTSGYLMIAGVGRLSHAGEQLIAEGHMPT